MSTKIETTEKVDTYYAKIDSNAVVLEVFKNPDPAWVETYNRENASRLRACPPETQVGWVRKNAEFSAPVPVEE